MKKFTTQKAFYMTLLSLMLPIALQQLISFGIAMTDTMMVGRLGTIQLSAVAQANQPTFVLQIFVFGLASGGTVLASQYWGKEDIESVRKVVGIVLRFAIIISLVFASCVYLFPEQIMHFYLKTETDVDWKTFSEAVSYMKIIAFSYLFFGITFSFAMIIRSVEIVKISVLVSLISFFVNVFFNWVFIFGNLGAKPMGVRGAALGTLIARITEFVIIFIFAFFADKRLNFKLRYIIKKDSQLFKDFIKYSLPVVANELAWVLGITVQAAILGKISSEILAANSIAGVFQQLATIMVFGIGSAAGIIVGKLIGEGNKKEAMNASSTLMKMSVIIGIFGAAIILLFRKPFVSLYNIDDSTRILAQNLLIITAGIVFFMSITITGIVGVLRGAGDTKFACGLEIGTLWMISIPLGLILGFVVKAPILLIFAFLKIDEPIKSVIAYVRILKESTYKSVTREN